MAREHTVVRGIVLRGTDTKESDKILTVLTAGMGKLTVIAKGARSRRSRVAAAVQTLAYSEMVLAESRGWQYLSEASTIALFDGVRKDVELLALACYLAELTEQVTYEEAESGEILSLLLNALYALDTLHRPQALVKAAFELKLMSLIGFEPLAERCAAYAWKGCKLAAVGDFETIPFPEEPERQPGFLVKGTEVEFLSPRRVEEAADAMPETEAA